MNKTAAKKATSASKTNLIAQVHGLADDCAEPDWDGNGASSIDRRALAAVENFIRALPNGIPLPELAAEPDGSISLDWIQSCNRLFSVSVGSTRCLACAWSDGADKGHAVASFDGTIIPPTVLDGIGEVIK